MDIRWNRLIGQERIRDVFSSALASGTLGHAYMLCGETGTGTFAAALEMAMALHCTDDTVKPCGGCAGCRKVLSFNHPDFHIVMPLALQKEHKASDGKITEAGWDELVAQVKLRIADPYYLPEYTSIPSIPVDWIREVTHAIRRGATENGRNVIIIDGINTMQQESANAMLKTLEEPPPQTVFLLCTPQLHTVLPTIVSRCQILRFSMLSPEQVKTEMVRRFSVSENDPRLDEVMYCGSITRACQLFTAQETDTARITADFLRAISSGEMPGMFSMIDSLDSANDFSLFESIFTRIMYGIRNAFFEKMDGTENYIMGDRSLAEVLGAIPGPHAAEKLVRLCETAISQIRARANPALVMTQFAFSVMEFFNEQKQ